MNRPCSIFAVTFACALLGVFAHSARTRTPGRAQQSRMEELRSYARPAEERIARDAGSDELRVRLAELDRELWMLAPPESAPEVQAFSEFPASADVTEHRAWVERALPALQPWLHVELCATRPAAGAPGSADWFSLPARVDALWSRGERIAMEPPRFLALRNWGNVLAWHAFFESQRPREEREPWELEPAQILASVFPLGFAFDDASFIGTVGRTALEQQAIRAGRTLLERRALTASSLRAALEPWLARSAAFQPSEMIEGELRAFLTLYDRARGDSTGDEDAVLEAFADVEEAFEMAQLFAAGLDAASRTGPCADQESFAQSCLGALCQVHRHRSVLALCRVALALLEHRERTGALPDRLEDLGAVFAAGLPTDPLTGSPFPYRLHEHGARLGPTACPRHGSDACRDVEWSSAVD